MFAKFPLYHQLNSSISDDLTSPPFLKNCYGTNFFCFTNVGNIDKFIVRCYRSLPTSRDIELLEINSMWKEIMRTAKLFPHSGRKDILNLTISLIPKKAFQYLLCTP